ncbi:MULTISPECIES: GntR family transcriptional regulator [unclassified Chelatococcus]|uniref:GntR family transcriptional regulator n=1 Tax=unclassified Chelatococcus TaxID=2638111 RepID=UPI001BCE4611|nr:MULTISPECIES: GntR family transcriptional regulator [unclassified Chelatococcus]MBS7699803.1 GntR family transcriptional regulator [Chelatococcus sp. YT9]MBX3558149.1 GntR family transcriptional regulator [Chelatococcus sp.]
MAESDLLGEETAVATSGEQAYARIRADIVFGRLKPAQRLTLEKLRPTYGVGISTLREILSRLTPEGLVIAEGQRGFQVAPCSTEDLREIAALRLLIEKHALSESFRAGDMEWEGRVVAAHHKLARMEAGLLAGDTSRTEQWKRYDWEFHQALVSACGSRALLDMHSGIYDRYLRYQMVFVIFRGGIAAEEHKALLTCALNRDTEEAQRVLERHVQGCLDFAFENSLIS